MPRRQRRRYYNPWGQGGYEFDKWLLNLAPAEGQNAYEAQNAYNEYARNSEIANAQNYAGEAGWQSNTQASEAGQQNSFQNVLSPAWEAERENAQAAINESSLQQGTTPLAKWMRLIDAGLYNSYKDQYYNIPFKRNNYNCIIVHMDGNGAYVKTPVDVFPNRLATTYIIVTNKTFPPNWNGEHGSGGGTSIFATNEINATISVPFVGNVPGNNASVITGATFITANMRTTATANMLGKLLTIYSEDNPTVILTPNTTLLGPNTIVTNPPSPFVGGPANILMAARSTIINNGLIAAGVQQRFITTAATLYGSPTENLTVSVFCSTNPQDLNSIDLPATILPILPNSGYPKPPTSRP
jgi:hypothetical protein